MLEYSGMSYKNTWPKKEKSNSFFLNDKKTDVQCYTVTKDKTLNIIFRGSDSLKDFFTDFRFWKSAVPYDSVSHKVRVHSGFLSTYKSKDVHKKIKSFVTDKIEEIKITGHSYGAALAILCAFDLQYIFPEKDVEVVVFGCPRVGNKEFKKLYEKNIFKTIRIENRGDIVTKIPFAFMGYRHVGATIKIGDMFKPLSSKHHNLIKYYSFIWNKL